MAQQDHRVARVNTAALSPSQVTKRLLRQAETKSEGMRAPSSKLSRRPGAIVLRACGRDPELASSSADVISEGQSHLKKMLMVLRLAYDSSELSPSVNRTLFYRGSRHQTL